MPELDFHSCSPIMTLVLTHNPTTETLQLLVQKTLPRMPPSHSNNRLMTTLPGELCVSRQFMFQHSATIFSEPLPHMFYSRNRIVKEHTIPSPSRSSAA